MGLRSALERAFASVGSLGSTPVFGPGPEGTCGAAAGSTTAGIRPVSQDTVSYTRGSPNRSRAYDGRDPSLPRKSRLGDLSRSFVSAAGQDAVELVAGADGELVEDFV